MTTQATFDFTAHKIENNTESEDILENNREYINGKVKEVFNLLKRGIKLTVKSALLEHEISSLPRRILDLKEKGFAIKDELIDGKFKRWYLQRLILNEDFYSNFDKENPRRRPYSRQGEEVILISESLPALIVENRRGDRFAVNENKVTIKST